MTSADPRPGHRSGRRPASRARRRAPAAVPRASCPPPAWPWSRARCAFRRRPAAACTWRDPSVRAWRRLRPRDDPETVAAPLPPIRARVVLLLPAPRLVVGLRSRRRSRRRWPSGDHSKPATASPDVSARASPPAAGSAQTWRARLAWRRTRSPPPRATSARSTRPPRRREAPLGGRAREIDRPQRGAKHSGLGVASAHGDGGAPPVRGDGHLAHGGERDHVGQAQGRGRGGRGQQHPQGETRDHDQPSPPPVPVTSDRAKSSTSRRSAGVSVIPRPHTWTPRTVAADRRPRAAPPPRARGSGRGRSPRARPPPPRRRRKAAANSIW